jgi:hypothetical protein
MLDGWRVEFLERFLKRHMHAVEREFRRPVETGMKRGAGASIFRHHRPLL